MCDWIALAGLGVQILIFVGLVWYAWETRDLRKASQEQNKISQEQNEATQKPCLVPLVRKDRSAEVILYSDTEMVLDDTAGSITLCNIGNGPAFNVEYKAQGENPENFLPYIPNQSKERTTLSLEQLRSSLFPHQDEEELALSLLYEGDREYQRDRDKNEAIGCPVLTFLGVRRPVVPRNFIRCLTSGYRSCGLKQERRATLQSASA